MENNHMVGFSLIDLIFHRGNEHALVVYTPSLALAIDVAYEADLVIEDPGIA